MRGWNKKGKVILLFAIVSVISLISSMSVSVSADEIDDLLSKTKSAPNPKPSVMVTGYALSPETLMPGDVGVLTITLENMQDKPIERDICLDNDKVEAATEFTMNAYIKEAYLVERDFKVYNRYISAGVIGPGKKVDFAFKIKAPSAEGIYMLKFIADIEDMKGKSSRGIRYYIPIIVSSSLKISPMEVSRESIKLEVTNEGISEVNSVAVLASDVSGIEFQRERIYIGKMKPGESAIAVFNISGAEEGENSAVFKAAYKNGINKHESKPVCVRIPCCNDKEREKGESLLEEHSAASFSVITATPTPTPTPTSSSSLTPALKLPRVGVAFAFAGLLPVAYLLLLRRKRKGNSEE
ncbi:MAG: hypothetical protein WA977_07515 [Halobacteriota archaeon]